MTIKVDALVLAGTSSQTGPLAGGQADNGSFYIAIRQISGGHEIEIHKASTVGGTYALEETWAVPGGSGAAIANAILVGNTIHCFYAESLGTGMTATREIFHREYDCSTDAWDAAATLITTIDRDTSDPSRSGAFGWDDINSTLYAVLYSDTANVMGQPQIRFDLWTWTSGGGWVNEGNADGAPDTSVQGLQGAWSPAGQRFHLFCPITNATARHFSWNTIQTRDNLVTLTLTNTGAQHPKLSAFEIAPAIPIEGGASAEIAAIYGYGSFSREHIWVRCISEASPTLQEDSMNADFNDDDVSPIIMGWWNEADDELNVIAVDAIAATQQWKRATSTDQGDTWTAAPWTDVGAITDDYDQVTTMLRNFADLDHSRDVSGSTRIEWAYKDGDHDIRVISFEIAGGGPAAVAELIMAPIQPAA